MEFALSTTEHIDYSLSALAYELKHPLIRLARQAELTDCIEMQQTAEQALTLIDTYLLAAQAERGQLALVFEPVHAGSILYDASMKLRALAKSTGVTVRIDSRSHDMVMTHPSALGSLVATFGSLIMSMQSDKDSTIVLRSYTNRDGQTTVGAFGAEKISSSDIASAVAASQDSHMPLAKVSTSSHASLQIADSLCRAVGGALTVKRMGKLWGLTTELPRSEQLILL